MAFPVAVGEFVLNQLVAGFRVGNAQQGFGQTHQRHAFLARQAEFVHQGIDAAGFGAVAAHLGYQAAGQRFGGGFFRIAHLRLREHIGNGFGFVAAVGFGNGLAQGIGLGLCKIKHRIFLGLRSDN